MKLSESEIKELKNSKSEAVKKLLKFYQRIIEGDVYEAYISSTVQFDTFLSDLKFNPQSVMSEDKGFERSLLIMKCMKEMIENINYLRIQLSDDQQKEAKREAVTLYDKARQILANKE
jgi:hypothetical protein